MKSYTRIRMSTVWVVISLMGWAGMSPANIARGQTVLYVKADASGDEDGMSWTHAFVDLQDALALAEAGDEIWVAAGTYTPGTPGDRTATFELKSGVGIYGGFAGTEISRSERDPAANATVLSGDLAGNDLEVLEPPDLAGEPTRSDNSYHVVTARGVDKTAVLDGLIITAGYANGPGNSQDGNGGGMISVWREVAQGRVGNIEAAPADPTIANCTFHGNSASSKGGGMYNEAGDPSLDNCVFRENHSNASAPTEGGGGLFNEGGSPSLWRCRFVGNTTTSGGAGLYNRHASPIILDTVFDRNAVTAITTNQTGGGILNNSSDATIADCTFTGNSASHGGGVENWLNPASTFVNCLFIKNRAALPGNGEGGGLQSWGSGCTPHVVNCTFVENTAFDLGGGLGASDESGGAGAIVSNCIFWGNRARNEVVAQLGSSAIVVTYSCVQGGRSGEGNIDVDPLFADPENGDYRLKSQAGRWNPLSESWAQDEVTSPCIDAGDPMDPIGPEPFPNGGFVNMGAYGGTAEASKSYFGGPVQETIVAGDINGDGQVDQTDLDIMSLHWTGAEPLQP